MINETFQRPNLLAGRRLHPVQEGVTGNPPRNLEMVRPLDQRIVNSYLSIVICQLNETSVWLRMVCRAELMTTDLLAALIDENQQLCRILNASVKTAKKK